MGRNKLSDFDKHLRREIATNLNYLMKDMTQKQLSELTGIPASTLSWYLSFRSTPNAEQIKRIAEALNVDHKDIDPRSKSSEEEHEELTKLLEHKFAFDLAIKTTVKLMCELNSVGRQLVLQQAQLLKLTGRYDVCSLMRQDQSEYINTFLDKQITLPGQENIDNKLSVSNNDCSFASPEPYLDSRNNSLINAGINLDTISARKVTMPENASRKSDFDSRVPVYDYTTQNFSESMEPTIAKNDIALIRREFARTDNEIYLIDIEGYAFIRRIVFGDERLVLRCDCPNWPAHVVTGAELDYTTVLGKVVGWVKP